jgi:hypothetical protein
MGLPFAVSRFDVAAPFIVAVLLVLIGGAVGWVVLLRLRTQFSDWVIEQDVRDKLPATFTPEAIKQISGWTVDCAQVLTGLLAPLVGLVLLKHSTSSGLQIAYLGAFAISFLAFVWFLAWDPSRYGKGWPGIFTPILVVMLLVNVGAAAAAYAVGPSG